MVHIIMNPGLTLHVSHPPILALPRRNCEVESRTGSSVMVTGTYTAYYLGPHATAWA